MVEKIKFWAQAIQTYFQSPIVTDYFKGNESKYRIAIIDKYDIKGRFRLTDRQIINLTCGCPILDFTSCDFQAFSSSGDVFKTECTFRDKGKRIASFERTIDFRNMEIINDKMIVNDKGQGICTKAFLNQLSQAFALNFKTLSMQAAGGEEYRAMGISVFDGYHHWAKYGYILDNDDEIKFQQWISDNGRKEKSLWEVCMNPEAHELWKKTGFHWYGTFEICKKSLSFRRLRRYLIRKRINASSCKLPL